MTGLISKVFRGEIVAGDEVESRFGPNRRRMIAVKDFHRFSILSEKFNGVGGDKEDFQDGFYCSVCIVFELKNFFTVTNLGNFIF